jgi:VanZ family protein
MNRLRWWWPALAWAALTAGFSTDSFSVENTSAFIVPFFRWILPGAAPETLALLHHLIRKCAHLGEYFLLSLLILRGVRAERGGWRVEWAIWAVSITTGWAALDELHQAFVPSRGPSLMDVLLDACGAAAAQVVCAAIARVRARTRTGTERAG